jgi:hypothetical protein
MVVVLGFFFREDEDIPDVDLSSSNRSDEFRKAPTINGAVHLLPGVHMIGWYSVARIHAFIPIVWFRTERRQALFCVDIKRLLVHGEVRSRKFHEGGIGGLAKECSSLRDVEELAWCFGIRGSGMKVRAATQVKFRVLPFQGENPRSSLNWLCLAMTLLEALF